MNTLIIKDKPFFYKLYWYLKRVITNTGPHGKHCGCNKWGHPIGLGCPKSMYKLTVHGSIGDKKI